MKGHLMTPLQNLQKLKDEKQLMADLWCHFGKVFVSCVDEGTVTTELTVDFNNLLRNSAGEENYCRPIPKNGYKT